LILNQRLVLTGDQARRSDAIEGEDEVSNRDSSFNYGESIDLERAEANAIRDHH
jgi:hypothetical protein